MSKKRSTPNLPEMLDSEFLAIYKPMALDGRSMEEIAVQIQRSKNYVSQKVARIRQKCRDEHGLTAEQIEIVVPHISSRGITRDRRKQDLAKVIVEALQEEEKQ